MNVFEQAIEEGKLRKTDDNCVSVIDLVQHICGYENSKDAAKELKRLKMNRVEVAAYCRNFKFPGRGQRDTPITDFEGAINIIMLLPGKKAATTRLIAAKTLARYLQADITLADDIIQRTEDPEKLKWIENRAKGVRKRNELTDTMKEHGVKKPLTYAKVSNLTNVAVLGKPAKDIKKERGIKSVRDSLTSAELIQVAVTEDLERSNIVNRDADGDAEVIDAAKEVTNDLAPIFEKYRTKEITGDTQ